VEVRLVSGQLDLPEPLAPEERDRLAELEGIVEPDLEAFLRAGAALSEIRDRRLYRETHSAFDVYLRERWGWSRSRGYQLIDAARTAGVLSGIVDTAESPWQEQFLAREGVVSTSDAESPADTGVSETSTAVDTGAGEGGGADDGPSPDALAVALEGLPLPTNEYVYRQLATRTLKEDPGLCRAAWERVVERFGEHATAEQTRGVVAEVVAERNGEAVSGEVEESPDERRKRFASAVHRMYRNNDARAARQVLAMWKDVMHRDAKHFAEHGIEPPENKWPRR
jgi:hypothetical protein